jgi:hypothetical protein
MDQTDDPDLPTNRVNSSLSNFAHTWISREFVVFHFGGDFLCDELAPKSEYGFAWILSFQPPLNHTSGDF